MSLEQEIIKLVLSQGVFAVLFVWLLFFVLRENSKREERLLKCLEVLGEKYDMIDKRTEHIETVVGEIKDNVKEMIRHG